MTPPLPIPTDNIYKFACLFGLALIVSSIFAFVSAYTSSLGTKIKYSEILISIEAKEQKSKAENDLIEMYKQLLEVTKSNEKAMSSSIGMVLAVGTLLSVYGGFMWHQKIQQRDDRFGQLQLEKLEVEIAKLRSEIAQPAASDQEVQGSNENEG